MCWKRLPKSVKIEKEIFEFFGKMPEEKKAEVEKVAEGNPQPTPAATTEAPKNGKPGNGNTFCKIYIEFQWNFCFIYINCRLY